jgi:acyl-CoA thioester hydrolase
VKRTPHPARPGDDRTSVLPHRVAFWETDAMGIMHHANYVKLLEQARVLWMDEHDIPYRDWVAQDRHFAVTGIDVRYKRAVRFDDPVEVAVWVDKVGGASCRIGYELRSNGDVIATAVTEHGMVDGNGRPVRIPAERRASMAQKAAGGG